eukprot:2208322-Amphidinium_carterae.1
MMGAGEHPEPKTLGKHSCETVYADIKDRTVAAVGCDIPKPSIARKPPSGSDPVKLFERKVKN